jgi:hypothetical protein
VTVRKLTNYQFSRDIRDMIPKKCRETGNLELFPFADGTRFFYSRYHLIFNETSKSLDREDGKEC